MSAGDRPSTELWRDFRRNRGALIGLVVVVLLVLCALLADVIAPHSPSEQYRDATLRAPSWQPINGHRFVLALPDDQHWAVRSLNYPFCRASHQHVRQICSEVPSFCPTTRCCFRKNHSVRC